MIGVVVNAVAVFVGAAIGMLLKKGFPEKLSETIMKAMGLITILIGIQSAIKTEDVLCVIICLVLGTVIGELINIDKGINSLGDTLKAKLVKDNGKAGSFTEGFVSTCILFCVGSMTIMGSLEAGINHDYSILFAKSTMDFISSIVFASALGFGVMCTSVFVLVFQGAITLLASALSNVLTDVAVVEMSAVGGVILLGLAVNILELYKNDKPIRVANMLPAIFLPPLYLWVTSLF